MPSSWGSVGTVLYCLLISTAPESLFAVILLVTLIVVVVTAPWGLTTTYINERFRTGVRASGFGLGYSLAVIPPAFYAFYQAGLASFMPFKYTPLPLLVIGALLMLIGALWGPETRDVDFHEEVGAAPEAGPEARMVSREVPRPPPKPSAIPAGNREKTGSGPTLTPAGMMVALGHRERDRPASDLQLPRS